MRSPNKQQRVILAVLLVAGFGLSTAAYADDDLRGVITGRAKDGTLTVRADDSSNVIVVLDDDTKVTRTDGLRAMKMSSASLEQNVRTDLADHKVVTTMTVYFENGSASIGRKHKEEIEGLAGLAKGLRGYVIQIEGHASAVGPDALNDTLSMQRADAVAALLSQNGIPPTQMLVPATMGVSAQVAPNQTAKGQSENRRVVVTLLQNKGISDSSAANRGGTTVERVDPPRR